MTSDHRVAGSSPAGCMPQRQVVTSRINIRPFACLDTSWTLLHAAFCLHGPGIGSPVFSRHRKVPLLLNPRSSLCNERRCASDGSLSVWHLLNPISHLRKKVFIDRAGTVKANCSDAVLCIRQLIKSDAGKLKIERLHFRFRQSSD